MCGPSNQARYLRPRPPPSDAPPPHPIALWAAA
jgi:hypothetical protein